VAFGSFRQVNFTGFAMFVEVLEGLTKVAGPGVVLCANEAVVKLQTTEGSLFPASFVENTRQK
jgi:hypothetical protein